MPRGLTDDERMICYLLGDLSEDERLRLEEEFFTDDKIFEQLSALEDELIDDYVHGNLSEPDRNKFEHHFLSSPERRQRVEFATSLASYISRQPGAERSATESPARWRAAALWQGWSPAWRWALVVAGVVVTLSETWLITQNRRLRGELGQARALESELRQLEQELQGRLARLGAQSEPGPTGVERESAPAQLRQLPAVLFKLAPPALRGAGEQPSLVIPPGTRIVELQLDLEQDTYPRYQAALATAEGREVWRGEGVKSGLTPWVGKSISFLLSSRAFQSGDYVLKLRGTRADGVGEEVSAYSFRVVKR